MGLSKESFKQLVEQARDTIFLLDTDGIVIYANAAAEQLFGRPVADLLGQSFGYIVTAEQPTEIQIPHPHRGTITADIRSSRTTLMEQSYEIVYLRDVTKRKHAEEQLRRATLIVEQSPVVLFRWEVSEGWPVVYVSENVRQWGYSAQELIGGQPHFMELVHPDDLQRLMGELNQYLPENAAFSQEYRIITRAGEPRWVEDHTIVERDTSGNPLFMQGIVNDITERKRTQEALQKINRALRVLSEGNSELIHAEAEPALLEAICRLCVELGGYRMAWVGFAQQDKDKSIRPVAQAGFEDGYLDSARITWANNVRGHGPTGRAIRTGMSQVTQDILTDPSMAPCHDDALRRGYRSGVALPLNDASAAFGVLVIYADQPGAFDPEELRLLEELANHLAFGITTLRAREQHRLTEKRITHLAYFDELTELPNRNRLMEALAQVVGVTRSETSEFALLTLNVARFGETQAGIGVRQADELLHQIATRLQSALHEGELLARIGGDEFAILLGDSGVENAQDCALRVEQALRSPFQQAGIPISVQMRIGAAIAPEHGQEPEVLLLRSGMATRQAKRSGRAFALYGGPTESESPRHLALITELRTAIEEKQFLLHYQPKVDLVTEKICGVEALVRWQHPDRGIRPPGDFIGIAEQTGLIDPLTYLVLDAALQQSSLWSEQGFDMPVAVNISVNCFYDPDFLSRIEEMLRTWNIGPGLLQLEITESTLMEEPAKIHDLLDHLRDRGIHVSIDDFGTGYSSLNYVASLPIHALKIDRSFVIKMAESERTHSVVAATIALAHTLGIRTVAEGVDAKEQAEALFSMGCSEIQGYFFSQPLTAEELRRWVADFSLDSYKIQPV